MGFRSNRSIGAVVVLYNPEIDIVSNMIRALSTRVDHLVLVNNGCAVEHLNAIARACEIHHLPLTTLGTGHNIGLAGGLNKGIQWANTNKFSHVLLLDQDSIPHENMVMQLMQAIDLVSTHSHRVAVAGPIHIDPRTQFRSSFCKFKELAPDIYAVPYLQSSGSLIALATIQELGDMDERLFIHHVDQEWCMRAQSKGFKCIGVETARMQHIVGDDIRRIWLGHWRDIHIHSPIRHYFMFRNSILLFSRNYISLKWKMLEIARLCFMAIYYTLTHPLRFQHLRMMLLGLAHGVAGKTGKLTSP